MTYYLSGPMAGYPEHNFPAFEEAAAKLREIGLDILSPHEVEQSDLAWDACLKQDLALMCARCDGLILIKGWPQSRGARLELQTALALDWPVSYWDGSRLIGMNKADVVPPEISVQELLLQRNWSIETFGPGPRTRGVIDHITKELTEILENPTDVEEWIDVVILALDGAWRSGASPHRILDTYRRKMIKNRSRTWPDWRSMSEDKAIEHVREVVQP